MTLRRRTPLVGLTALLFCVAVVACSTSRQAERGDPFPEEPGPGPTTVEPLDEIRAYLAEEEHAILAKVKLDSWHRVAGLFGRLVDGASAGPTEAASARRALIEEVSGWAGDPMNLQHVDGKRHTYFVFAPYRHDPSQGCLSVGLPCALVDQPGPRYGRAFLPTDRPGALAADLRDGLGQGVYRVVEHAYWVRVEFALQWADLEQVDKHLEVRARDNPDPYDRRQTPARTAFIERDAPFAFYFGVREAVDAAMYAEEWRLNRRLSSIPADRRLRHVLASSAEIGRLVRYYMPRQAEVEDISVFVDGTDGTEGGGQTLQIVSTRTRTGQRIAEAATSEVRLPAIALEEAAFSLDWSLRLDRLVEQAGRAEWVDRAHLPLSDFVGQEVGWSWIGWMTSPSAALATMIDRLRAVPGGPDLSRLAAGRIRLQGFAPGQRTDLASVQGGGVLLVSPGEGAGTLVGWAELTDRRFRSVETAIVERPDGFIEIRFGLHMPVARLFPGGMPDRTVSGFGMRAERDFVEGLVARWGPAGDESVGGRIATALTAAGGLSVEQYGGRDWTALQIGAGAAPPARPVLEDIPFEAGQLRPECLDGVALQVASMIERALQADEELSDRLDAMLSSEAGRFQSAVNECGRLGQREDELATWAGDFYDAWRAVASYRAGGGVWRPKLRELCGVGYPWACNPTAGEFPWQRQ